MTTEQDQHDAFSDAQPAAAAAGEAFDPQAAALYVNDMIVGLAESEFDSVELRPGRNLPFFGCYSGMPMRAHYLHIVERLKELTETIEPGPQAGDEVGFFMVVFGEEPAAIQFRYLIEIGARDSWVRVTIQR